MLMLVVIVSVVLVLILLVHTVRTKSPHRHAEDFELVGVFVTASQ
jgi:hypothetical protein